MNRATLTLALALLCACAGPSPAPEALAPARSAAKVGEVIISEILYDAAPGATEWFELHNTTDQPIDLKDWSFKDNKAEFVISSKLIIPAKGHVVLGQNDDIFSNGGVAVDLAYGDKIGLSSAGDELHLLDPSGDEIDAVVFGGEAPWPSATENSAISLDPSSLDADSNDKPAAWCLAKDTIPGSDPAMQGSPGAPNPPCNPGSAGAAGSGSGGGPSAGAGGSPAGAAGQPAAGSGGNPKAGAGGSPAAGNGGAPTAGSGGAPTAGSGGGPGSCKVHFSKIDLNQPDADGAAKDTAEAIELQIEGPFEAGKTTLAGCGLATISPHDADATGPDTCGPAAEYYAELAVGSLVIPASGLVVVGNVAASSTPWLNKDGAPSSVLKNGPDLLALRGPKGEVLEVVSYADNDAPDAHASCSLGPAPELCPADVNTGDGANQILVRCPGPSWLLVAEADAPWGAPNPCGSGSAGSPGAGGATGNPGGSPGKAGAPGSGASAGSPGKGGAGGAAAGVGGAAAGSGGSAFTEDSALSSQNGDCDCRGAGKRAGGQGAWLAALAALALARRRR